MAEYTEVSRRIMYHEDTGMACGPVSMTTIDAEIVLEKDGKKIYLHGQWVDQAGDEILYEATEESLYDVYEKLHEEETDELMEEINRRQGKQIEEDSCFETWYRELKQMILAEMKAHGWESEIE